MQSTRRTFEDNIDFNIPGSPHSAEKQSHGVNIKKVIQKIENHPQRQALQSDLPQHRQFNPFSKESQDVIKAAGNIELCELLDVEPKAQCKVCLTYWDVGIAYCTCGHFLRDGTEENKRTSSTLGTSFRFPTITSRKGDPTATATGRKRGSRMSHCESSSRRNARREISWASTTGSSAMKIPKEHD